MSRVEVVQRDDAETYDDATFEVDSYGHLRVNAGDDLVGVYAAGTWLRARTLEEDQ